MFIYPFTYIAPYSARNFLNRVIKFYSKIILSILRVHIDHQIFTQPQVNALVISNHLSYLDIFIIFSLYPAAFVTSIEMKKTPILGQIVTIGGCLFVERRSRKNLSNEIKEITNALIAGLNVVIFPEATSTNGEKVIRFKRPLFQSAIDANTNVLPVTINYQFIDGEPVTKNSRDGVCWYGDMSIFSHILKLVTFKRIDVSVTESAYISPTGKDITELSSEARNIVASKYNCLT